MNENYHNTCLTEHSQVLISQYNAQRDLMNSEEQPNINQGIMNLIELPFR